MALMKWGKYSLITNTYYDNETVIQQFVGRYALDRPWVQGYDGYSFSSASGFSTTGNGGDHIIAFNVYDPTTVWMSSLVDMGGEYFEDLYIYATCSEVTDYSKGSFIEEVIAEEGTYPDDGVYGSYWYVKVGVGFPGIKMEVNNAIVTAIDGWTKIDNTLHKLTDFWGKIGESVKKAL